MIQLAVFRSQADLASSASFGWVLQELVLRALRLSPIVDAAIGATTRTHHSLGCALRTYATNAHVRISVRPGNRYQSCH